MSLSLAAAFTIFATAGFPVPPPASYTRTTNVKDVCPEYSYACVVWPDSDGAPAQLALPKNAYSSATIHEVAHMVDAIFLTPRERHKRLAPLLKRGIQPIVPQEPGVEGSTWIRFYAERYADSVAECLGYRASYAHRPKLPKPTRRYCRALIPH